MPLARHIHLSGETGIRTPGPVTVNGFQDRRIKPLCHLSRHFGQMRRKSSLFFKKYTKIL